MKEFIFDEQLFSEDGQPEPTADEPTGEEGTPTTNPEGEQPDPQDDTEYDIITYNKEEVKIPVSERQTYLQKGYNYDKLQSKFEAIQNDPKMTFVDELAKTYGYNSAGEYMEAVKQQQEQARIDELVQQGMSKEMAEEMQENRRFREQFQKEKQTRENQEKEAKEFQDFLDNNPNIDTSEIKPEVWQIRQESGISLTDAYNRIRIQELEQKIEQVKQETEQETIKKINQNGATSPGTASSGGEAPHKKVADMSPEEFAAYREEVRNRNGR